MLFYVNEHLAVPSAKIPRYSWYSFYRPQKDERLSQTWSQPVVLNMGPLDCKSSTLTARPSGWVSSGPSLLLLFKVEDFPHLQMLNLTYCSKSSLLLAFCFLFNCMTNLTQICMIPWNSSNGKMDDILPLELLQGIIHHIERKKVDLATGGGT